MASDLKSARATGSSISAAGAAPSPSTSPSSPRRRPTASTSTRSQIEKAWENPNLPRSNFTVGDFNGPLQFDDATFDAVYAIQPLTYVTDHEFTFREVHRVLKPGGMFVMNDVAALDAYDRDNEHHRTLIQHTRELTVFGGFWYYRYWEDLFRDHRLRSDLLGRAERRGDDQEGGRPLRPVRGGLQLPPEAPCDSQNTDALMQRMNENSHSYIRAEEEQLLTLNWHCVAQKPE